MATAAKKLVKERTFGFGLRAMKKYPELVPLVSILSVAGLGALSFTTYSLFTKPDVQVDKRTHLPPWERIDPERRAKFVTFRQKYEKIPELEDLKKEIGSFRAK